MPDPSWPSLPPEANYLRLVGPGSAGTATTVASAVAWQALMASHEAAFSLSTLNTAATAIDFDGVGGVSSVAAANGLNAALQLLAGWAQEKPPVAASAVAAYETAVSSMIPAEVCIANRTEQAADVAMNPAVFGALTPAIIALDAEYFGEHWPHNAGIGAAYGATLAALTAALAIPPPLSPPGASVTAPVTAGAAVSQAAGRAVAGEAMKESGQLAEAVGGGAAPPAATGQAGQMLMQPIHAALGVMQPALGMFQTPVQAMQGLAALPQSMTGSLRAMPHGAEGSDAAVAAATLSGGGAAAFGSSPGALSTAGGVGGVGGLAGSGITSYVRPTNSFAPEGAGRPVVATTGLLSATESRGAPTTGPGLGAIPMSPAGAGMLARARDAGNQDGGQRARIVAESQPISSRPA